MHWSVLEVYRRTVIEMSSVFVSHASQDTGFAAQLASDLEKHGYPTETMSSIIPATSAPVSSVRFDQRLKDAISDVNYFIPVLTPDSLKSRWVMKEIETAISHEAPIGNVTILPVLSRDCVLPAALGLRSPADFTVSYLQGLQSLLDKMLEFNMGDEPSLSEANAINIASEAGAVRLYKALARFRGEIYSLSPRDFEGLVAESLRDCGYDVELTHSSKDGGIDLVAIGGKDTFMTRILLQCKRYSSGKRIGVEVVRSLAPVKGSNFDAVTVVTSSFFTDSVSWKIRKHLDRLTRCRWEFSRSDWSEMFRWLASMPELAENLTRLLSASRDRYAALIDKRFLQALSSVEIMESRHLEAILDAADAAFYEPLKQQLIAARDNLLKHTP